MGSYYTYLISSLPVLRFGQKLPFTFLRFLEDMCKNLLDDNALAHIAEARIDGNYVSTPHEQLAAWHAFDTALRNELVKIRSNVKRVSPSQYQRGDVWMGLDIVNIAARASHEENPLESERILDKARWDFLESLAVGHYFDIVFLMVYAHQLLLLEKWERIVSADVKQRIEHLVA
jgi:hypothetical protein